MTYFDQIYPINDIFDQIYVHKLDANSRTCYDKAMEFLDAEYGSPHIIASSYLRELETWPIVKNTDTSEFRKLYRFLLRCQVYKTNSRLQELDSSSKIRSIVIKLHSSLQEEWSILVERTRRIGRYVNFNDSVEFIDFHSARAIDPAYSRAAMSSGDKEKNPIKGFMVQKFKIANEDSCHL